MFPVDFTYGTGNEQAEEKGASWACTDDDILRAGGLSQRATSRYAHA